LLGACPQKVLGHSSGGANQDHDPYVAGDWRFIWNLGNDPWQAAGRKNAGSSEAIQTRCSTSVTCLAEQLHTLSRKPITADSIRYALNQWQALTRHPDNGSIEMDNSAAAPTNATRCRASQNIRGETEPAKADEALS